MATNATSKIDAAAEKAYAEASAQFYDKYLKGQYQDDEEKQNPHHQRNLRPDFRAEQKFRDGFQYAH